jgi:hypothetical protein
MAVGLRHISGFASRLRALERIAVSSAPEATDAPKARKEER